MKSLNLPTLSSRKRRARFNIHPHSSGVQPCSRWRVVSVKFIWSKFARTCFSIFFFEYNKMCKNEIDDNEKNTVDSAIKLPKKRFYGLMSLQRPPASMGGIKGDFFLLISLLFLFYQIKLYKIIVYLYSHLSMFRSRTYHSFLPPASLN